MSLVNVSALCLAVGMSCAWLPAALAAEPAQPFTLDDASVAVSLENDSSRGDNEMKYDFKVSGSVIEQTGSSDAIRADFKKGGKVLASARCNIDLEGEFACASEDQALKVIGPVDIALTYIEDETDKQFPLRTLKIKVVDVKEPWIQNRRRPYAQVDVKGLPGGAVAYLDDNEASIARLGFIFWRGVGPGQSESLKHQDVRCSVNGKRVLGNYEFSLNAHNPIEWSVKTKDGSQDTVKFLRYTLVFSSVAQLTPTTQNDKIMVDSTVRPDWVVLNQNPGNWACQLRSEGEVVREFRFKVAANGSLVEHPEQRGAAPVNLSPTAVLAEVGLGKPTKFDYSYSPAGVRSESFFGRAWSKAPATQAMLKALPAK